MSRLAIAWVAVMTLLGGCAPKVFIPQAVGSRQQTRVVARPATAVWPVAERVLRSKQGYLELVEQDGGLLRLVLDDGTHMTVFLEPLDEAQSTRVWVSRSRESATAASETALLDEITAGMPLGAPR